MANNTFKCALVSGKRKSNPQETWTGVAVQVTVNGVLYSGIIFPKTDTITPDREIKF